MFPKISHIDDLMPFVGSNQQIRVKDCEVTGLKIVSYMVQDEDTFAGEHEHFERECRGITFDENGKIVSRTLHKFFNIGQRDDVQPQNLSWAKVTRIMVKRDGSMVTPVLLKDGSVRMKTKKTFTSKEAGVATELLHRVENDQRELEWVKTCLNFGYTPTFEFTSPKYPIVLKYDKEELTLLHVRENVSGRYLSESEIHSLGSPFPLVENVMDQFIGDGLPANLVSWEKLHKYAMETEGVEGVVIQFGQEMVKLKTKWYCDLHHAVTFTRWRDIARAVVADQSDDLKGAFAMAGRSIDPIIKVEQKIGSRISIAENAAQAHAENGRVLNRTAKDMALALKDHELFGQIMRLFRGGEVNWMEWYAKNHLEEDFGLEVVGDEE
jgi:RNA ligase